MLVQNDVRECVMAPLDDADRDGRRLQALLHKCDVPLRHVRKGRAPQPSLACKAYLHAHPPLQEISRAATSSNTSNDCWEISNDISASWSRR